MEFYLTRFGNWSFKPVVMKQLLKITAGVLVMGSLATNGGAFLVLLQENLLADRLKFSNHIIELLI